MNNDRSDKSSAMSNLSIISWGPWSIPIPSRSNITASKKASSQNCSWSHSVERSLPEHKSSSHVAHAMVKAGQLYYYRLSANMEGRGSWPLSHQGAIIWRVVMFYIFIHRSQLLSVPDVSPISMWVAHARKGPQSWTASYGYTSWTNHIILWVWQSNLGVKF